MITCTAVMDIINPLAPRSASLVMWGITPLVGGKNPDYERCFHLSLSFYDPESGEAAGDRDVQLTQQWIDCFYGDNKRLLWAEPPYSEQGKARATWHYRLFIHGEWKTPLLPRKEVYSREFTEAGWKSWSDVQADIQERQQRGLQQVMESDHNG